MLGSALSKQASQFPGLEVRAPGHDELDVRDTEALGVFGDWECARDSEGARAVIVEGTRNVAELARKSGARLLFPQSFLVYDGHQNPIAEDEIAEDEQPRPLSL